VEALQRELDNDSTDYTLKLVLADRYDEIGSDLGAGYRALAATKRGTIVSNGSGGILYDHSREWNRPGVDGYDYTDPSEIPHDWFAFLTPGRQHSWAQHRREYTTREELELDLARAFTKLPPERQAQLLRGELT
jgi:hypothetical protein